MLWEDAMDIDVKGLTFRDATQAEKKRLFLLLNTRGFLWTLVALLSLATAFLLPGRLKTVTLVVLIFAAVALIVAVVSDMPAWTCRVCTGTVSNKREVSASTETGLYYNAVTFTSDKGEVLEEFPVYSEKTLKDLEEGSRAMIICYNKRQPVLYSEKQLKLSSGS